MIKGEKMSIKSKAKKIGKALLFKKLYSDLKAKKERRQEDIVILVELIEEWKAEAPDDLNCALASILVNAEDSSAEEIKAEVEKAKATYNAEDEDLVPWFESQIENLEYEDEEEASEE